MEMDTDHDSEVLFDRSVDHVKQVIQLAKLEESELKNFSQVISFSPQLLDNDVKLVHVSKEMADGIQQGDSVYLRGSEDESVVLCSNNKTYDFKEAETSNSMLILPDLTLSKDCDEKGEGDGRVLGWRTVTGVFFKYFELQEMRPRLQKLRSVMKILTEDEVKEGTCQGKCFEDLLQCIQSSEQELKEGLKSMEAVEFNGSWYLLEQDYQMKVLSYILKLFNDNSWTLDCVDRQETVDTLSDLVNKQILSQVFDMYCSPMQGGEQNQYSLEKEKVSRFYGDFLLVEGSNFAMEEFMDMWQKALPEGVNADISQLAGLALVDTESNSSQPYVKRFPETDLPNTIQERLEVLFQAREKWSIDEVTPYIQPLTTPKLNVNALLTKHARPVTVNGVKFFCAKHGK